MAAAPRAAQWVTAANGTRHPLIEISSDSSDDEVAAGGSCDELAPLDPAAAQAGDASEDDEREEEPAVAGVRISTKLFFWLQQKHPKGGFSP